VSVANRDKRAMVFPMKRLADLGFHLIATKGTADVLRRNGIHASVVRKHSEGRGPNGEPTIVERISAGEVGMVINTPSGRFARADGYAIRAATTSMDKPIITTVQQLGAAVQGIESQMTEKVRVRSLQDHARDLHLTFVAPGVAELARPGQFVALAVGGDTSATLLRRCFSIHKVSPSGTYGGTVDVVVAARGPGTRWLAGLSTHDEVNIIGPLGRAFPLPRDAVACVLVGGGYGSAPLFWLAAALRERGCHVEMVLGAATEDRLFGVVEARRVADGVTVTTD